MNTDVRCIAFFLPQFHPVAENDEWWGKGFTEWRNVAKARPLFPGHYQPHLPADLGFYDLRLDETREAQAALARQYGIHGFCYYHYWFNGRRILERPFEEILSSGKPDLPFCLCWANENWSRAWDGGTQHVLLEQHYSEADDRAHMLSLIPALKDARYIRINGRPLLLIYRTELLPNPAQTAEVWRQVAREQGIGEIYLARVENFLGGIDPASIGFDAAVEFSPNNRNVGKKVFSGPITSKLSSLGILPQAYSRNSIFRYATIARAKMNLAPEAYKQFRCVTPMWDNTARRKNNARILLGSTPQLYKEWLVHAARQTRQRFQGDERIVFINAWNEWAEGCHLEPDLKHGHAYLEATREALAISPLAPNVVQRNHKGDIPRNALDSSRNFYWKIAGSIRYLREIIRNVLRKPVG